MKKTTLIFLVSLCIFLGGCVLTAGCIAMGGPTQIIWTTTGLRGSHSLPASFSHWIDGIFWESSMEGRIEDAADRVDEAIDRVIGAGGRMEDRFENWLEGLEGFEDWEDDDWFDPSRHLIEAKKTETFSSIDGKLVDADLILVESDCWQVSYVLPKERGLEVLQVENGVLCLKQKKDFVVVGIPGKYRSQIVVSYPRGACPEKINLSSVSGDLKVSRAGVKEVDFQSVSGNFIAENTAALETCGIATTSGDADLSGQTGLKQFSMQTTSGDLSLEGVTFSGDAFEFTSTSGDVGLTECRFDNTQPVRIVSTSGDFYLKGIWTKGVSLKSTSGDMEGEGLKCGEMDVSSTSGSIDLSGALNSVSFTTISGDVRLKTTLPETQYRYSLSSGGRIQVNGERKERKFEQDGSPYSIQGTSGSGMIEIQTEK